MGSTGPTSGAMIVILPWKMTIKLLYNREWPYHACHLALSRWYLLITGLNCLAQLQNQTEGCFWGQKWREQIYRKSTWTGKTHSGPMRDGTCILHPNPHWWLMYIIMQIGIQVIFCRWQKDAYTNLDNLWSSEYGLQTWMASSILCKTTIYRDAYHQFCNSKVF